MLAIEERRNGADGNPKGTAKSMRYFPCHFIPKGNRSSEWTVKMNECQTWPWVSLPYCMMPSLTSSTFMYGTEKGSWGMPSLTLWPAELDKSKISNHFNTRLVSFLDNSKMTDVEVWSKRYWEKASNLACLQFGIKEGTVQSRRAREALRAYSERQILERQPGD